MSTYQDSPSVLQETTRLKRCSAKAQMDVHVSPQYMHLPRVTHGLWNALWYRMHFISLKSVLLSIWLASAFELSLERSLENTHPCRPQTLSITSVTNVPIVKVMVFPVSHVWMWELDHKENWVLKNWCFQIVVLEKTLESPLDSKETKPVII